MRHLLIRTKERMIRYPLWSGALLLSLSVVAVLFTGGKHALVSVGEQIIVLGVILGVVLLVVGAPTTDRFPQALTFSVNTAGLVLIRYLYDALGLVYEFAFVVGLAALCAFFWRGSTRNRISPWIILILSLGVAAESVSLGHHALLPASGQIAVWAALCGAGFLAAAHPPRGVSNADVRVFRFVAIFALVTTALLAVRMVRRSVSGNPVRSRTSIASIAAPPASRQLTSPGSRD